MADDWQSLDPLSETPADNDDIVLRDLSDTTANAAGTVKRNSILNFLGTSLSALRTAFTPASASGPASLRLNEDTDAGSTGVLLTGPAASDGDKIVSLQDVAGTLYVSGGTDVAVADGGTGAGDAAGARTALDAERYSAEAPILVTGDLTLVAATHHRKVLEIDASSSPRITCAQIGAGVRF